MTTHNNTNNKITFTAQDSIAAPGHNQHSSVYSSYVLSLLLTAYILSFIDRQVLSLLVGPIREDFAISDFEFSLLHGFAFAIFYILMGLPIGRLVDRSNRRNIISIGVFFWSIMTCLCGFAQSFWQLFLARIGVGVGEASLSPAAYSLISDYFSEEKLGRALSIYSMGVTLGGGMAFIIGGMVFELFSNHPEFSWPLIGQLAPWQSTFITVGLPGVIITLLLVTTVKEPPRRERVGSTAVVSQESVPIRDVIAHLREQRRAYAGIMMSVALMGIVGYGTLAWYPEFLQRSYGMDKSAAGAQFGAVFIIAGSLGTICGAWFTEFFKRFGYFDAELRVIMFLAIASFIPAVLSPLMPTPTWALALAVLMIFFHYAHFGVAITALQLITPNKMRGQISAVMLFVSNIFGLALGGSVIAAFTDFVFVDESMLNVSISVVSAIFYPLVAIIAGLALHSYGKLIKQGC